MAFSQLVLAAGFISTYVLCMIFRFFLRELKRKRDERDFKEIAAYDEFFDKLRNATSEVGVK